MGQDKAAGQGQVTGSEFTRNHGLRTVSAPRRFGRSWWFVICLTALLLVLAMVTRLLSSDRRSLSVQDYVHVVTTGPGQQYRPTIYRYAAPLKPTPSAGHGVALVSDIDDSSSEAAYQRSCLAALTRDKNPEIMALSEALREDMCTDPRRK